MKRKRNQKKNTKNDILVIIKSIDKEMRANQEKGQKEKTNEERNE